MATARKTAASKVSSTSFNPSDKAIKAADAGKKSLPVKKDTFGVRRPAFANGDVAVAQVAKGPKKMVLKPGATRTMPKGGLTTGLPAEEITKAPTKKGAKALGKLTKPKVDKRRETPQIKIGKVIIERPARKKSDAFDTIPTIAVKNVADTIKVFAKLPSGCTWMADTSSATRDTLDVYNKHGVHIAEVRIERKQ